MKQLIIGPAIGLVAFAPTVHADPSVPDCRDAPPGAQVCSAPLPPGPGHPGTDDDFKRELADSGVLFNWPIERDQSRRACDEIRQGWNVLDVVHQLMRYGGYPFDIANHIVTAAEVAYCMDYTLSH
jgi:hypothetical protein